MSLRWGCVAVVMTALVTACEAEDPKDLEEQILEEAEFRSLDDEFCQTIYTFDHQIDVGDGVSLHVIEKFTPKSVLRFPRRAMLMLPGTLVTNDMYDIDVEAPGPGLNALDRMALNGYFAYAVTYEGYGASSLPEDGSTVTAERSLEQMGQVVEWIRHERWVSKVDLLGTSFGSSLAIALGGTQSPINRHHVGRLVLQALVYKSVTPLFEQIFFSPETQAALENAPNGYVPTAPEMYGLILASTDPAAAAYGFANFPGVYATGPTLEGFDLPVFDAEYGRARALQFWGDEDLITPLEDAQLFQSEYAGDSQLSVLSQTGHAPYIGIEDVRDDFWGQTTDFLDEGRWTFQIACN